MGATVGDASPAPAPAAEEDDATENTVDEPTLLIPGHPNVDPLPSYLVHKLTYGDTREVMLSPSHRVVFYILQPGNSERAPSNMHFVATFREPNAAGCQGLTMRLRKHCVSDGSTSVACTQPLQRYAHADGVPASVVREKKVRGDRPGSATTTTTSLRTDVLIGGTKTLEWFEENEYTRRNTFPGWECGCTQGETKWDRVDEYGATWWVEFTNDAETEEARKKKNGAALSCQFQFRVHAVDICSGHGDWTTGGRDRVRFFFFFFRCLFGGVLFFFWCVLTDMTNHDRFFSTRARASATMVTKASTRDRWPNCHGGCFLFFCFHPVHSSFDQCSSFDLIMYIFFYGALCSPICAGSTK